MIFELIIWSSTEAKAYIQCAHFDWGIAFLFLYFFFLYSNLWVGSKYISTKDLYQPQLINIIFTQYCISNNVFCNLFDFCFWGYEKRLATTQSHWKLSNLKWKERNLAASEFLRAWTYLFAMQTHHPGFANTLCNDK